MGLFFPHGFIMKNFRHTEKLKDFRVNAYILTPRVYSEHYTCRIMYLSRLLAVLF